MEENSLALLPGEEVVFQLEGDVYGGGANPITQAVARLTAAIQKILGTKRKATLVVTNQRVLEYQELIVCWCIPSATNLKVVLPHSVQEVGYSRTTTCGFFPYFNLYYQSFTQNTVFPIKGGSDEQLKDYVSKFYAAIQK